MWCCPSAARTSLTFFTVLKTLAECRDALTPLTSLRTPWCAYGTISYRGFDEGGARSVLSEPQQTLIAPASSLPRRAKMESRSVPLGVINLSSRNITEEMETKVPLFLYFMIENHPDVKAYTELLIHQVDQTNRRLKDAKLNEVYQEFGKDAGLAIKLGLIDCLKEPALTKKFGIDPHIFPLIYFVRDKMFCDRLTGIIPEAQIKEAIEAFIDFAKSEASNEKEGKTIYNKIRRTDNDDENAMTLLGVAIEKLQKKDLHKAKELYMKSFDISMEQIKVINQMYGVANKKMTPELWFKIKREACYNSAPQALCGLAMVAMAQKDNRTAMEHIRRVRDEFPFAVKDMREVSEAVVRVEILDLAGYDMEKDSYLNLLKHDDLMGDPATFYKSRLKLVVAFFMDNYHSQAIEECLRLIRSERKLLPALKESGIVPPDLILGPKAVTPARQAILKLFEALGSTNEHVMKGRALLQVYI